MPKYVISQHGKQRLQERVSLHSRRDMNKLFLMAMRKGKNPSDFKPPFYDYLHSKLRRGVQLKVYRGMIFIYKYNKLITAYNVPEKYNNIVDINKLMKKYNIKMNKLSNHDLYQHFIKRVDEIIIVSETNMSVGMPYDDYIYESLSIAYVEVMSCIKIMETRTRITSYKSRMKINSDMVIVRMREFLNEFEELAPNIVGLNIPSSVNKTKSELHYDATRFTQLVENIEKCASYLYHNNFFLVSETVEESEGDIDGQENTEYNKENNI